MNIRILGSIIFFLIHIGAKGQVPGFFMKKEAKKVELPFISSGNLIIIPISINGSEPINFLLDTGVKTNILFSKSIGDAIGLFYTRKLELVGADGKAVLTASVSPNNPMDLGPLEGVLQTLLVLEEDFFELEAVLGIPVYGVIGYEFFKYNPVKIDYDRSLITFYESNRVRWRPLGYKKLDITMDNSKPYIRGKVKQFFGEEVDAKLLVDLGANHGLLLNLETSKELQMPPRYLESELGRSLGGDLVGYVGRVKSLKLSNIRFTDILTSYPEETEFSYVIKESGRNGSIGSEIWGRTRIIIDYRRDRILFKRGNSFGNPFEFDMSGISAKMLSLEAKRFFITNVRYGSSSYMAGVKAGDEIVSINRIPVDFWELSDLIKLFRSEEGRDISLDLLRYDSEKKELIDVKVNFKLKRQI
ncbi:aspartyl protease family protein [Mongoliitalea lutea]|uniref:PDZ domain-containing protein n=1 Tax=Mongoliitalea lutea TaxID=849756 RepID=A0A8J3CXT9_9BACT|nr:aspartyl protease family protein [Mongoliitalea lutea]GHB39919.1 hypothetical protein GCM10008106_21340 [Mongoliitalea lutea]